MGMMHLEDALINSLTVQVESTPMVPAPFLQEMIDETELEDEWV